jgi:hypothetical protein
VITEALLRVGAGILHVLAGLFPPVAVPSWLSGSDSAFTTVFTAADSMGVWFPATLLLAVLAGLLALWLVGFTIKIARMVLSLFTAGGGSAA